MDATSFVCEACGTSSVVKNNRAIVEEYRRLRRLQQRGDADGSCPNQACRSHCRAVARHPDRYRPYGRTKAGDRRWRCRECDKTFSIGRPTRRQRRTGKNGLVLRLLTNDTSLSKICEITGLSPRAVYEKIDFLYERVRAFTARREGCFEAVDWSTAGRRFATDSQSLVLNWPSKRTRALVEVQHLCTAHANSGYIVAAYIGFDPEVQMEEVEDRMAAHNDFALPRCFRQQARVWSQSEFAAYLEKRTRNIAISKAEAADFDDELQLPHDGAKIRQDIAQYAHALLLRRFLRGSDDRFTFVLDGDSGLARAFVAVFARRIRRERADVIVMEFDKHQTNDARNALVADGRAILERDTGIPAHLFDTIPTHYAFEIIDQATTERLRRTVPGWVFEWPYHTKSEPNRRIRILTDCGQIPIDRQARLMRLATLRSVDSYFHKVRSNVRATARPGRTPSANGRAWDRHYFYNPATLCKVIEIYRFKHNWMGSRATEETPAMMLGLAGGKVYERDLFG
jgi:transposase-like protein